MNVVRKFKVIFRRQIQSGKGVLSDSDYFSFWRSFEVISHTTEEAIQIAKSLVEVNNLRMIDFSTFKVEKKLQMTPKEKEEYSVIFDFLQKEGKPWTFENVEEAKVSLQIKT